MEWRCEWCEKPHEENDPPCDHCGHGTFERAIVREAPADEAPNETTVWACTECGRAHPKHAPPCSRCGNPNLVQETRTFDDESELGVPGYRDMLTTRYALGLVLAVALGTVLVLGYVGIVPLPGLGGNPVPEVTDVPGNATVTPGGVSLASVEASLLESVNDRRANADAFDLERNDRLDAVATHLNQRRAKTQFGDGTMLDQEEMGDLFGDACDRQPALAQAVAPTSPDSDPSAEGYARALGDSYVGETDMADSRFTKTGIDVHVDPDGRLVLLQLGC